MLDIHPITLEGQAIQLQPMILDHWQPLWTVGSDESLWRWTPYFNQSAEDMRAYVETALRLQDQGTALPFVTVHHPSQQIIGSTRFMEIDKRNHALEIGATWITPQWQRTSVNTEAKFLMLRHAFETLGCMRVQL